MSLGGVDYKVAIAILISSPSEIDRGVRTALELASRMDKAIALLCLQSFVPAKESAKEGKGKGGKPAPESDKPAPEESSVSDERFVNRRSYREQLEKALLEKCAEMGSGNARSEVFEIPLAIDEIRRWISNPPPSDKLGLIQIESLFLMYHRGAGSEESLGTKNKLFNQLPCEVLFVSENDDFEWDQIGRARTIESDRGQSLPLHCVGADSHQRRTARRAARRLGAARIELAEVKEADDEVRAVVIGIRGSGTHIESNAAWNAARKNETVPLAIAVNPSDSPWERIHWRIDNGIHSFFADYQVTRDQREKLAAELKRGTKASPEFILFMSVATFLAAIGLLEDSGAVIIGAMLVAPLMTPLLGAGLALLQGDWPGFLTAVRATLLGVLLAFLIGMSMGLVAAVVPARMFSGADLRLTGEMISRSHPNLLDPFIGLAAGLAGGFAVGRDGKIGALAGVAIAAALVPPIATAGLEAAMVLLCGIKSGSFETVKMLFAADPSAILARFGFLGVADSAASHEHMHLVHLVLAPLALFVMNACAVILGTWVGLRFVSMHRTMHPRQAKSWVSWATVWLLVALVLLLMLVPLLAQDP